MVLQLCRATSSAKPTCSKPPGVRIADDYSLTILIIFVQCVIWNVLRISRLSALWFNCRFGMGFRSWVLKTFRIALPLPTSLFPRKVPVMAFVGDPIVVHKIPVSISFAWGSLFSLLHNFTPDFGTQVSSLPLCCGFAKARHLMLYLQNRCLYP